MPEMLELDWLALTGSEAVDRLKLMVMPMFVIGLVRG